ncbi:hypothetical protein BJV74DRAFT_168824 [Russula compacta]|nr:hypothetical protein BJV74DRAFT_168824 [Russula compacta]
MTSSPALNGSRPLPRQQAETICYRNLHPCLFLQLSKDYSLEAFFFKSTNSRVAPAIRGCSDDAQRVGRTGSAAQFSFDCAWLCLCLCFMSEGTDRVRLRPCASWLQLHVSIALSQLPRHDRTQSLNVFPHLLAGMCTCTICNVVHHMEPEEALALWLKSRGPPRAKRLVAQRDPQAEDIRDDSVYRT